MDFCFATPLLHAVHAGHTDVVRALLAAGARTSVRETATEDTPLHVAAGQKDLEIVRLLLQHGAEARSRNLEGQRAVEVAQLRGHREIELLLRQSMGLAVPGSDAIQVSHILLKHSASRKASSRLDPTGTSIRARSLQQARAQLLRIRQQVLAASAATAPTAATAAAATPLSPLDKGARSTADNAALSETTAAITCPPIASPPIASPPTAVAAACAPAAAASSSARATGTDLEVDDPADAAQRVMQVFAVAAGRYSDCNSGISKHGALGSLSWGKMQKELEEAAFALAVGDVSGVVETASGCHLLLRTH